MSIPTYLENLVGEWIGTNRLWLTPEEPARESISAMSVTTTAQSQFLTFKYTWVDDGKDQDGILVIGQEKQQKEVAALWIDSWHMQDKWMICRGSNLGNSALSVQGSYSAPPGPDWGWRVTIESNTHKTFRLVMHNISPDGMEHLAVECIYARLYEEN